MIRHLYICNQVLQLYRQMKKISFPIEPADLIATIPNCRMMTYEKFAEINRCSIQDVVAVCESKTGCTHYDIANDRYLILWNSSQSDNNVEGRRRWTKAHELGHVILNHLSLAAQPMLAENNLNNLTPTEIETEADVFAATLLCPMPIFQMLDISSPSDISRVFGLSAEASANRWNEYLKWSRYRRKTAWENDMRRVLIQRS